MLDRDERFAFLPSFIRFELERPPTRPLEFEYDAIICDPPFANFELTQLHSALVQLAGGSAQKLAAPLYIAFNSKREEELKEAFGTYQALERMMPLGYESVKPKTQKGLFLYGPPQEGDECLPVIRAEMESR